MKKYLRVLILCALGASIHALAGDAGVALKADVVRAEPFADAKTVGNLVKNENLGIVSKKGAWLQVKTKNTTGWVRLLSVKRGSTASSGSSLSDVASGRTGTGKIVSTTGIRGLSAEELKAAKFNEDEMKKMESYQTSTSSAQSYAASGGLSASNMAYLKGAQK